MKQLTADQINTLENVFSNYPNTYQEVKSSKYSTMEGIMNQLENDPEQIFYIDNVSFNEELKTHNFSMIRMEVS